MTFITIAAFMKSKYCQFDTDHSRGVARGGGKGDQSPPEFGRSVNPIQTIGADYAHHTTIKKC